MTNKRRVSLSVQINLMFSAVTLVTSILFIIIFRQTLINYANHQSKEHFKEFHNMLIRTEQGNKIKNEYYTYVAYRIINENTQEYIKITESTHETDKVLEATVDEFVRKNIAYILRNQDKLIEENNLYYIVSETKDDLPNLIVSVSDNYYAESLKSPLNNMIIISFLALIILGNIIILIWSGITIQRISELVQSVSLLGDTSYSIPISDNSNDEIGDLARAIEKMRVQIVENDETKQEMLQNLSHDIKTPIAVIKTYAEAIKDGIAEEEDIEIIIKQTDLLTNKVTKLLEWNRIEYLSDNIDYYPVDIRRILISIANNYKYKKNIKFELDLDNSYLDGLEEHYFTMFSNIVENGLRYAKSTIKITLKNKRVSIYNDGDPIDEKFINNEFKPYEKGHKGQFGLGLTIVQKTTNKFNLKLNVRNINNGVEFIIEPL